MKKVKIILLIVVLVIIFPLLLLFGNDMMNQRVFVSKYTFSHPDIP